MAKKKGKKRSPGAGPPRQQMNKPRSSASVSVGNSGLVRSGNVRLSQCMIVKNEESNIKRALGWAKDFAYEQIIVDTGSTDRTVEMAKSLGAKVFHFEWIKDFAAAKNFAIEQATGDWIAFLDADEYMVPEDALRVLPVLELIQYDPILREQYSAVSCPWVHLNDEGQPFEVGVQERLFVNHSKVRYVGKIHESLSLEKKDVVLVDDFKIMHTGYAATSFKETGKAMRNIDLLRLEVEADPNDMTMKGYLAESLHAEVITNTEMEQIQADAIYEEIDKLYKEVVHSDAYVEAGRKKKAYSYFLDKYAVAKGADPFYENISERALRSFPEDWKTMCYRASAYNKRRDFGAAFELLKKVEAQLNDSKGTVGTVMSADVIEIMAMQFVLAAQGLSDMEYMIKYAGVLLVINKTNTGVLIPYISTLLKQNASIEEIITILANIYDMKDAKDLLLIARSAKDCGGIELAQAILSMAGEIMGK